MDFWIQILYLTLITNVCSEQFFNTMPPPVNTNFTCKGRDTGFYADIERNCRVYHMCDENGNKFTYHCPAETAFRQEALVCDHAHLVDCSSGRRVSTIEENVENKRRKDELSSSLSPPKTYFPNQSEKVDNRKKTDVESFNSGYTRSFRITKDPSSGAFMTETPRQHQPTFVLSSSVYLRSKAEAKKVSTASSFVSQSERMPELKVSSRDTNDEDGFSSRIVSTTAVPSMVEDIKVKEFFRNPMIFRSPAPARNEQRAITTGSSREIFTATTKNTTSLTRHFPHFGDTMMRNKKFETNNLHFANPGKFNDEKKLEPESGEIRNHRVDQVLKNFSKNQESKNERERFNENTTREEKMSRDERPTLFHDNFPYSETLRSMQAIGEKARTGYPAIPTPVPSVTTPGTEFPVFALTASPLGPNELEDDPYYPKRSTTTEAYYKLRNLNDEKKSFRSITRRPWPGSLNFEIPEVLPDLNTLDDLVDRRKYFFIPRVLKTS